jgi:hypothetical protein
MSGVASIDKDENDAGPVDAFDTRVVSGDTAGLTQLCAYVKQDVIQGTV